mgnify:CR=1 FL=1
MIIDFINNSGLLWFIATNIQALAQFGTLVVDHFVNHKPEQRREFWSKYKGKNEKERLCG